MGVLTDYFRAADAAAVVRALGEHGAFDGVELKGIDPVVCFGQLVALVRGARWDPGTAGSRVVWPADPSTAESWVFELGTAARDALAAVPDEDVPAVSVRWAATDELAGAEGLEEVVVDLVGLARRARDAGERLYCWCTV
ncbi:hypothetical protein ABZ816_00950 [Actinosynnema sp. NPDC047251]|uniref:DUF1877 family protein n=1 Tax=Saccharothrix espanaensis (strain ATCC 51144 / DSM 44229 / JCM 9112 / NBRC 15066 / NRRL 15764) TaxID=1179773 RepID=K0JZT5_SACES|nr:hypothetical protein [Saccharothrix espanaensis]CCH30817.1 hypothetical protein BN6_35190 [Saccharothrix espanaensis DSM 44229]